MQSTMKVLCHSRRCTIKPLEQTPHNKGSASSEGFRFLFRKHYHRKVNLMEEIYRQLAELARCHGAQRLVLFGSRARGDNKERSDIDLAVYGMPQKERAAFWLDAEDLPTLLKLDIVHILPGMDPKFLENIEKDGVTLYAAED